MNCPRCNKEMMPFTYSNVEVDRCPECSGIFLDKGELEQITEKQIGNIVDEAPLVRGTNPDTTATCPKCAKTMIELTGAADVRFDWCDTCEGMFFDKGELSILHYFKAD